MRRRRGRAFVTAFAEAVRLVAEDYMTFVRGMGRLDPEDDPRGFAARHAAAKACLAHLEALLDLIGEDGGLEQVRDGFALLQEAQAALGAPALLIEEDPIHDDRAAAVPAAAAAAPAGAGAAGTGAAAGPGRRAGA